MNEGNKYIHIPLMVEVFKTNVESEQVACLLIDELSRMFPNSSINFDLEDCDKILRMEGNDFTVTAVEEFLKTMRYSCVPLKD